MEDMKVGALTEEFWKSLALLFGVVVDGETALGLLGKKKAKNESTQQPSPFTSSQSVILILSWKPWNIIIMTGSLPSETFC